jgi:alkylresorcinol/alkylpyrone synthase
MMSRYLETDPGRRDRFLQILESSRIEVRHSVLAEGDAERPRSLKATNDLYIQTCLELGEKVARKAIERAGLVPGDIDSIISVSCTGYMIPSVDAYLINRMQLSHNVRRTPITLLGCMAGAVALSRAWEQIQAYPDSRVLVLSVELPSLTFQPHDHRPAQIISSMIFADGAAAMVVSNKGAQRPSPRILGGSMYTIPGTIEDMGYDLDDDGLHIVLSAGVPGLIRDSLGAEVEALLARHGVTRSEVKWCAMHPAGPKVLKLVEVALGLGPDELAPSWKVLREYGNMSSAAVLFVLAEMLEHPTARPGDLGLIVGFGPGLTGEIVLARWEA